MNKEFLKLLNNDNIIENLIAKGIELQEEYLEGDLTPTYYIKLDINGNISYSKTNNVNDNEIVVYSIEDATDNLELNDKDLEYWLTDEEYKEFKDDCKTDGLEMSWELYSEYAEDNFDCIRKEIWSSWCDQFYSSEIECMIDDLIEELSDKIEE